MNSAAHNELILDQFNRQAATFAERHAHTDPLDLLLRTAGVTASDTVLDLGCGPGIVACAFAAKAAHVTGFDLAPAMLEKAKTRQVELSLANMTWLCGDVSALPFADNSFSMVVTRYTFHHFLSPAAVLAEMVRVCRPGGRIVVADVTPAVEQLIAYDHFETLRDPSHAHALSPDGLKGLFTSAKLHGIQTAHYGLEMDFEDLMSGSFPNPQDVPTIWQLLRDDLSNDSTGLGAQLKDGKYIITFPTTIVAANKAA
ncbi:class I SAM-dependent methyltransferase [Terracidiphilus gabretensis]|jgi:ubiquinone/menaquinone biosynthesis C-methylase UbiE|uniref:class I SAM-dependent methyltransferase n=1 Tax=Terracidiphilus gabretensis TaxID=1577687 RepID=UPI00071BBF9D|nr:class I SAM-dependent methyltransferase [Terracidiphilus gabretensis]